MVDKLTRIYSEFRKIISVIKNYYYKADPQLEIPLDEYKRRQKLVLDALEKEGFKIGLVFSDEHYCGDVPYLGGNTNISIEQVAGILGNSGFHIIAGLEGGYIAEQLAPRADAKVHKVELLKLADEDYPIKAEKIEDVLEAAANEKLENIQKIALLTPRQVIPASITEYLNKLFGEENVIDVQELYYEIKYEKSDIEMKLIEHACIIADAMMEGMLSVLKPGMLETEVAAWGYFIARMLGSEEDGFKIMVGANEANRTLIGPALNREIKEGDYVHLGVAPKRDGLNSCIRRSVVVVDSLDKLTEHQKYWLEFIEEAYKVAFYKYVDIAKKELPAKEQELALLDFFKSKSKEVSEMYGKEIALELLKPYTGTHNSGYTECQEFYGAITLDSDAPLGNQIVMMLDVAVKGIGDNLNDVIIPDMDFIVIENTIGKFGKNIKTFTQLPLNCQDFIKY
ncbi:MAG: M24 family metallopeptidase [Promethearchaeota archaeon]|nr:MAG: M24 family metallopeptidase [Candidatus Lokiarchaeota archaeon]